jgi:hypothetical protein
LRIVGSFGCKIDTEIVHASCFKSLPSEAKNGVVAGFVGFVGSHAKKRLHQLVRRMGVDHVNAGNQSQLETSFWPGQKDRIWYLIRRSPRGQYQLTSVKLEPT